MGDREIRIQLECTLNLSGELSKLIGGGASNVIGTCGRVADSEAPREGGTPNADRTAVAGSSIDAGPKSNSAPSSRQKLIESSL